MRIEKLKYLDETDKRILKLISNGYTYKEISREIYKSVEAIKKRISCMKQYYNCTNIPHLIAHCTENELY